jgi:hypothetical protein
MMMVLQMVMGVGGTGVFLWEVQIADCVGLVKVSDEQVCIDVG